MGGFEVEDVDDPFDEVVIVLIEKLGDYFVIVLEDLLERVVNGVFLKLNGVVDDDVFEPILADVVLGYWVVLDYLPDQIVGPVEDSLQSLVLAFLGLVDLLLDLLSDFLHDLEQLVTDLQVHADVLDLLDGQQFSFDLADIAVLDEGHNRDEG